MKRGHQQRGLTVTIVLAALIGLAGPDVHAEEGPAPASPPAAGSLAGEERRQGNLHFRAGRYQEAVTHYEKAYQLDPDPKTAFNMAQAHRFLRNYPRAIELYREYLRQPADPGL